MAHGEQIAVTECPFCDYASQYPGKVKKHLTDEHPTEETKLNEDKTLNEENVWAAASKLTDCPFCSFTSIEPEEFRQHVLTNHLNDKNFRCLICNRLYRYRGDCKLNRNEIFNEFFLSSCLKTKVHFTFERNIRIVWSVTMSNLYANLSLNFIRIRWRQKN